MKVKDIMSTDVKSASPSTSLREAATAMRQHDIGCLPVCDGERLTGMITDRDIVIRGLADGLVENAAVQEAMSAGITWCYEDDSVEDAARLMNDRQIRRLPVVNREKRLVGIVSLGDLAVRTADEHLSGATLEAISEPPARQ